MKLSHPFVVGLLTVALVPVAWLAPAPVSAGSLGDFVAAAQIYEHRMDEAWLGPVDTSTLDRVTTAGVEQVRSIAEGMRRRGGPEIVAASAVVTDPVLSGTPERPILEVMVEHAFTYHVPEGDSPSTEAIPTVFEFVNAASDVLASVVEVPDGEGDKVEADPTEQIILPSLPLRPAADPAGASCSKPPPTYCVSREAAASYASAHACSSCHDHYVHYYKDHDCTNFISTALFYGGWQEHGSAKNDTSWWYKSSDNHANTWTVADAFSHYLKNSGWADEVSDPQSLRVGDVLQADWYGEGTIEHTMMVTAKDSSGIKLSYHSNDRVNEPLAKIVETDHQVVFHSWRLHAMINTNW
jgi:hypothetical protein